MVENEVVLKQNKKIKFYKSKLSTMKKTIIVITFSIQCILKYIVVSDFFKEFSHLKSEAGRGVGKKKKSAHLKYEVFSIRSKLKCSKMECYFLICITIFKGQGRAVGVI